MAEPRWHIFRQEFLDDIALGVSFDTEDAAVQWLESRDLPGTHIIILMEGKVPNGEAIEDHVHGGKIRIFDVTEYEAEPPPETYWSKWFWHDALFAVMILSLVATALILWEWYDNDTVLVQYPDCVEDEVIIDNGDGEWECLHIDKLVEDLQP